MAIHSLVVNGRERRLKADNDTPLLWILRDVLGLTGTKFGCGMAQCGDCTVHLDGKPVRSCGPLWRDNSWQTIELLRETQPPRNARSEARGARGVV